MNHHLDSAPRKGVFRDIHAIYDLTEVTPGLPVPTVSPARAVFDYRHVVHAEAAREAVAIAAAVLSAVFGVSFAQRTEIAGDDTPRYLLEALLPSGLTVVIVSRFENSAGLLDELLDSAQARREMAEVAA